MPQVTLNGDVKQTLHQNLLQFLCIFHSKWSPIPLFEPSWFYRRQVCLSQAA